MGSELRGVRQIPGYRAQQVLEFARHTMRELGRAPSYREIMAAVGISTPGHVSRIVSSLERRGMVQRTGKGRVRRISLCE